MRQEAVEMRKHGCHLTSTPALRHQPAIEVMRS